MKLKNIKYLLIAGAMTMITSCTKDFLEADIQGKFLTDSYYKTEEQAFSALVATYDPLRKNSGGFNNMITMMNAGSDDHVAGGEHGNDGKGIQGFSKFVMDGVTSQDAASFWSDHYQGVFRANTLLQKLPQVPMSSAQISRFTGEAKALRALYYFNLVRMYKNIPLFTVPLTPENMRDQVQVAPSAVYAQIETDLLDAIPALPITVPASESGRFTQGAVKALLGKVYLYDGKNVLAAAQLADVNGTPGGTSMFGYKLVTNYNDLWVVANKFNTESIIEVAHSNLGNFGDWGSYGGGAAEGNIVNVMVGPRNYLKLTGVAPALPSGWSFNVITQDLHTAMTGDPRFGATILDLKAMKLAGDADYIPGYQDTGYFLNKFTPRQSDVHTGAGVAVHNYQQDTYIIRLADTYLMEAEALGASSPRALALVNAVRVRAGATPLATLTMNDIKLERRLELAGEGHRFFDLVRWGDASSKLGSRGFVAGKNEVFPIPYKELENTKLVQNPGYN